LESKLPSQTLPEALNTPGWVWTSGGSGNYYSPWTSQTATTHDGVSAASTTLGSCYDTSYISTTVTGPGKICFWYRVDNQVYTFPVYIAAAGNLYLSIDAGQPNWFQQSQGVWYRATNTVPAGQHTLRWNFYRADAWSPGSIPSAYVNSWAYLDEVTFVPDASPPLSIVMTNGTLGYSNNCFGFAIVGPAGSNAVIAASSDLQSWKALATNSLGAGTAYFADSEATNFPTRFYRVLLQP
jgi:hypothetical protein